MLGCEEESEVLVQCVGVGGLQGVGLETQPGVGSQGPLWEMLNGRKGMTAGLMCWPNPP